MHRYRAANSHGLQKNRAVLLWVEFCLLFIGVPSFCCLHLPHLHRMLLIWSASAFCAIVLLRDRTFEFSRFWQVSKWKEHAPRAVLRFAALAVILVVLSAFLGGGNACSGIGGHSPVVFTLLFYPFLSVYPQGIIYRAFLFHRYRRIVPDRRLLILISAMAFAYGHIIFNQPATVGLTMAGGLLFAWTYVSSGSLVLSCVEHALYGDLVFVLGMWKYFFHPV